METGATASGERVMGYYPEELEPPPRDCPAFALCVQACTEEETAGRGHEVAAHCGVVVAHSAPTLELSWSMDRAWCVCH